MLDGWIQLFLTNFPLSIEAQDLFYRPVSPRVRTGDRFVLPVASGAAGSGTIHTQESARLLQAAKHPEINDTRLRCVFM